MNPFVLSLILIICYSIYSYFKKTLSIFEGTGVPYLPGWPIFGNMTGPVLGYQHIAEVVQDMYNVNHEAKYIGAFDFTSPVIVLRDPELIKTIAIKNFENFSDHKAIIDDSLDPFFGGNLFNMAGDRWRKARALLSPAFTGSKMKTMHELLVECAENVVNYLDEISESDRKMMATKDLFAKFTNDAIATCAFGIKVDSLKNPDNEFYILGKESTIFDGPRTLKFSVARASPKLYKLLKLKFISDRAATFFTNVIKSTVETRDREKIQRPDMIQLMMNARDENNKRLKLNITEMTAQAFIFFSGGFEMTSTQMCIIAHELAINLDIQNRLQEEIDNVMKSCSGKPAYEDIQNMRYLDAVFNESIRMHTQVHFTDRLCKKDFELPPALPGVKPFILKSGMDVLIPSSAIHRDPKYYENPDEFNPDRYFEKKMSFSDALTLGFGIGPRSCIGNRFATLETKIIFFYLLQKFNLRPCKKTFSPLVYSSKSIPIKPDDGFWLSIEPRKLG